MARRRRGNRSRSNSRLPGQHGAENLARLVSTPAGARALLLLLLVAGIFYAAYYFYDQHQSRIATTPSSPPAATHPASSTAPLRIATWNLRKFSDRAAPDLVSIARIIRENQFHLLAIQEVQREGQAVERLRRQLNEPWRNLVSERTGNNERYAFVYRADLLESLSTPSLMQGPDASVFDRVPCIASFRAGAFDFTLVTVHLSYTDLPRRRREAETLARYAKSLAAGSGEKDVIVLGDFNEQDKASLRGRPDSTGKSNLHFFDAMGWQRLNFEATNFASVEYVYDNILIDPSFTKEFTGRVGVVRFESAFSMDLKRAVDDISDHRPVYADFATTIDDD